MTDVSNVRHCPECLSFISYKRRADMLRAEGRKTLCLHCANAKHRNPAWKGHGDVPASVLTSLTRKAKIRGIDVYITLQDIASVYEQQHKRCALSGVMLKWNNNASVDRIDSNGDYTIDNIQIVDKAINMMKGSLDDARFQEWCKRVAAWATESSMAAA